MVDTGDQVAMTEAWTSIDGDRTDEILLIADHASSHVPDDIDLGLDPALLNTHVALDIGVAQLAALLCERIGMPAILGGVSRLVIDLNREVDAPGLIPISSDGHIIPGNDGNHAARIARFWEPYHAKIARTIAEMRPRLLISLHSFTPSLRLKPKEARPWEIGVLYNCDDRAARIAISALGERGVCVGDNLPYSGKVLNATMNRHGEANGIPYLGLEVRQDIISEPQGVARWAEVLAPVIEQCLASAGGSPSQFR
jgi:predicted N-formylglutamate amidohydrolase